MDRRRYLPLLLLLYALSEPAAAGGDVERGREVYERCEACHALARNRTGPKHCGLLGRRAGSLAGFAYSPAMRASGLVWDAATLDRFLADPLGLVPESSMGYDGVKDAGERADLIAFLATARPGMELCD